MSDATTPPIPERELDAAVQKAVLYALLAEFKTDEWNNLSLSRAAADAVGKLTGPLLARLAAVTAERDGLREAIGWFIRLVTADPDGEIEWATVKEWLDDFAGHVNRWRDEHADLENSRDAARADADRLREERDEYRDLLEYAQSDGYFRNDSTLAERVKVALAARPGRPEGRT